MLVYLDVAIATTGANRPSYRRFHMASELRPWSMSRNRTPKCGRKPLKPVKLQHLRTWHFVEAHHYLLRARYQGLLRVRGHGQTRDALAILDSSDRFLGLAIERAARSSLAGHLAPAAQHSELVVGGEDTKTCLKELPPRQVKGV